MAGLTQQIAEFVAHARTVAPPEEAVRIARTGFVDTVATMLAGRNEPVVGIARGFVTQPDRGSGIAASAGEASLLLSRERAPSRDAALVNATAGHALDYDDVAIGGHPSTVLVPAVLAEAERLDASGMDALRAYLVGYEAWAELSDRDQDSHHLGGWHPTAVFGAIGAAAAAACLGGLDATRARHALAIAASMAGGLIANFGTMTKPFHAGLAAAHGIDAVRLARAGMTGAADALEHHAGFLAAVSPRGRVDRARAAELPPERWRILRHRLSIKKYPMCYATHRVVDAVLDLAAANDLRPADVKAVHATVGVAQATMLRNHAPVTGLEAKFSLEFAVAAALAARSVGLAQLTDEMANRPEVRGLFGKVSIATDDSVCPYEQAFSIHDRVVIDTVDGRRLDSGPVQFARGHAQAPLRDEDLHAKFVDCTAGAPVDAASLYDRLLGLPGLRSVRLLSGG